MHSLSLRFLLLAGLTVLLSGSLVASAYAARARGGPTATPAPSSVGQGASEPPPPPPSAPPPSDDTDVGASIKGVSEAAQAAVDACETKQTTKCIADVLDKYAADLKELAPRLPPELRGLPDIVATAARKVRAAKTRKEALHALGDAIAEVHKTIALLKADDPIALKAETREGGFVAETLQAANTKLEKAVGL